MDPIDKSELVNGNTNKITRAAEIRSMFAGANPAFLKMYVLEVISDPTTITSEKITYWEKVFRIEKPSQDFNFTFLPRNCIIAQRVNDGPNTFVRPKILFPMFPSHLALPCKPGELVWVMYENPEAVVQEFGYWICRVAEPHYTDDVNHSHAPEKLDNSKILGTKDKHQGKVKTTKNLLNGKGQLDKEGNIVVPKESITLRPPRNVNPETVFEDIVKKSDAAQMMQYEAIPRFKKRPGDVALEGSNNTLIVLGTDRTGPVADYVEELADDGALSKGEVPEATENDLAGEAGSIDLVTGRGTLSKTGGTPASTNYINGGGELKKELNKIQTVPEEGDPDFKEDRSRILISQRTKVDTNFSLKDYNTAVYQDPPIKDSEKGDAAIVIKSDKIRIIARSDISFIVTDYEDKPGENGKLSFKSEVEDYSRWASITIKKDGSIIFTPSNDGYIKLGGDDASRAILCTDNSPVVQSNGSVSVPGGILTQGADPVGIGGAFGTFATKILVK